MNQEAFEKKICLDLLEKFNHKSHRDIETDA